MGVVALLGADRAGAGVHEEMRLAGPRRHAASFCKTGQGQAPQVPAVKLIRATGRRPAF